MKCCVCKHKRFILSSVAVLGMAVGIGMQVASGLLIYKIVRDDYFEAKFKTLKNE